MKTDTGIVIKNQKTVFQQIEWKQASLNSTKLAAVPEKNIRVNPYPPESPSSDLRCLLHDG